MSEWKAIQMSRPLPSYLQDIANSVHRDGYVFLRKWLIDQTTADIGRSIGEVVDMRTMLPQSGIPTVQTLRPRHKSESPSNRYSGTYGLTEFPLHTDLAHWALPPHYLILRCKFGSEVVGTRLLPYSAITSTLEETTIRRAMARPRHTPRSGAQCLLPLIFPIEENRFGFRWDPLFLVPMNLPAQRLAGIMRDNAWDMTRLVTVTLKSPGDTLIVDNWQLLHGRRPVLATDLSRCIERIYLSELYI
jgi:L-asparagine oxygenase